MVSEIQGRVSENLAETNSQNFRTGSGSGMIEHGQSNEVCYKALECYIWSQVFYFYCAFALTKWLNSHIYTTNLIQES